VSLDLLFTQCYLEELKVESQLNSFNSILDTHISTPVFRLVVKECRYMLNARFLNFYIWFPSILKFGFCCCKLLEMFLHASVDPFAC